MFHPTAPIENLFRHPIDVAVELCEDGVDPHSAVPIYPLRDLDRVQHLRSPPSPARMGSTRVRPAYSRREVQTAELHSLRSAVAPRRPAAPGASIPFAGTQTLLNFSR